MPIPETTVGALYLLARIRFALGDNGTRMQDELLEYCRELRDSAGALAALGEDYDALKGRVAELEALHRTYYNQPFAEACQRAAQAERERIIGILTDPQNTILWKIPTGTQSIHADPREIRAALIPTA